MENDNDSFVFEKFSKLFPNNVDVFGIAKSNVRKHVL